MRIHSHRKNPTRPIPSTMIIIPAINIMVAQLIPLEDSLVSPVWYQKSIVPISLKFRVFTMASMLCIPSPNTKMSVSNPQSSVTTCRSNFSVTINKNITRKITTAMICTISFISSSLAAKNATLLPSLARWHLNHRYYRTKFSTLQSETFFLYIFLATSNHLLLFKCYEIVTIFLYLANTNKSRRLLICVLEFLIALVVVPISCLWFVVVSDANMLK